MNLIKNIVIIGLMAISMSAFAGTNGLTPAQEAEIQAKVAEMKAANAAPKDSMASKVVSANDAAATMTQKWAEVSMVIGNSLVDTASKLGVEANKFATTPLGRLTTYLIVWNFLGKSIVSLLLGLVLFFGMPPIVYWLWNKSTLYRIEYEVGKNIFGKEKKLPKVVERIDGDAYGATTFFCFIAALAGVIAGSVLILNAVK